MAGTTRLGFAIALLTAIGGAHDADSLRVMIAWQMVEGQTAGENDPLASINEHDPHGAGGSGNRFSFASIDNALAQSTKQLSPGHVYASIGDAFRARKNAYELIDAIQRAGWCGGPKAPCPGYGAAIKSNLVRITDQANYQREAMKLVGNTAITGAPQHYSESDGITAGDVAASLPGAGLVSGAVSAADAVGTLAQHLLDASFWKRAGVMTLGALLALWGLMQLGHSIAPNVAGGVKRAATIAL